jgi:RNA polymerase sigma factor for flagellar operon FliA
MHAQNATFPVKGATEIRDRAVIENLGLVRAISLRVYESLPVNVDLEDLIHAGVLGLIDAVQKFDATRNVSFQNYAKHRIKGAILDSLRDLDWASRDVRRRQKRVEEITRDISTRLGRAPSESEIAEQLGVSVDRWRKMAMELNTGVSTPPRFQDEDRNPVEDVPAEPDLRPDRMCERKELRVALDGAIQTLPERYRRVVALYYTNEMTMKEIGDVMGVNESRVSQMHKLALKKMAAALESEGICSVCAV